MAETPFVWGRGGRKLTPDQIERERESAALLAKGAMDYSPVAHWSQGLNRVAQGLLAGLDYRRADNADAEIASVNKGLIESLLGGGTSVPSSGTTVPMTSAAGEVSATSPNAQPLDMSGNEVYNEFIGAAREGGLTNPFGLAALAATGKAESGYSPENVNRTWSDPSQSGQPGTAGGILSWRGPRYDALAATGDLSPRGQGNFFIKENPQLIAALNNAQSVEEAQSAINNAWRFAGYDQPGGETARRLELARGFLPTFQGSGEVAAATPQAAIEAVAPLQPIPEAGAVPGESLSDEVSAYQQTPEYAAAFPGRAQTAQAAVSAAMPVQVAGGGDRAPMASPGINQAIVQALTNPQATPQTQRLAAILMEQEQRRSMAQEEQRLQAADPVRQMQLEKGRLELEAMRNPTPEFRQLSAEEIAARGLDPKKQYQISRDNKVAQIGDSGTNVTVNNGEGDKFYENLDKKNAEMFSALSEAGVSGRGKIAQINRLENILSNAPQGGIAALKQAAGEYGINTEGLSDIQAAQALINELVPQQRQPGSGPMSDADLALFKQSLPRIINQEGGNALIVQTMRGVTDYQIKMGEIADAVADRSMNPTEGRAAIRNLANPLDAYTKTVRSLENDEQDAGWREISPGVRVRKID